MKKERISLCMIVKNEEKLLERCLNSVKGYVDEMIVVDTGSTDRTWQIAESCGAVVLSHEWNHDFAEARNVALKHATGDWILQLDADEYFIDGTQHKIKEAIEGNREKDAFLVQITNLIGEGQIGNSHVYTRLFKNKKSIRYEGNIHEQLKNDGQSLVGEWTTIRIVHSGYMESVVKEKGKKQRNMQMLKKELQKNPKSGFHHYNMSNEYIADKRYQKSLDHAKKAYHFGKGSTYESNSILNIVWSLYHLGRYEEALSVLKEAVKAYEKYTDLVFLEGIVMERQGRTEDAKTVFRKCIELGESDKMYYSKKGIGSIVPAEKLAYYSLVERDYDTASQYLMLLLGLNRRNVRYALELGKMLKRNMNDGEVSTFFSSMYDGGSFEGLRAELMLRLGLKEGIRKIPLKEELGLDIQIKILWFNGRHEEASERCQKGLLKFGNRLLPVTLAFAEATNNQALKNRISALGQTGQLLVNALGGRFPSKKMNYNGDLYIALMREFMELGMYDSFEKLYSIKEQFAAKTIRQLAEMLFDSHFDDLSLECYSDYLQTNKGDHAAWLRAAEMLLAKGDYKEAILFADQASRAGAQNFRALEVVIESLKAEGERDELMKVCAKALESYPTSSYLLNAVEKAL